MPIDPHILNLYEAFDLRLNDDIFKIAQAALSGKLKSVVEKLDGQNLTFTVNSAGSVRFIGKGCPTWIHDRGGLSINETYEHFYNKPSVAWTFKESMEGLQYLVDANAKQFVKACHGGLRSINAEVITPTNTNVIRYKTKHICFHGLLPNDVTDFDKLCKLLPATTNTGWRVMASPTPKFKGHPNAQASLDEIRDRLHAINDNLGLSGNPTVGDVCLNLITRRLRTECSSFLAPDLIFRAAERLLYEDASLLGKGDFHSAEAWSKFKLLDDDRIIFVGEAIAPLDSVCQLVGSRALEAYDFVVTDGSDEQAKEHRDYISKVREAYYADRIQASSALLHKIGSTIERVDEKLFTRNVEGIVFEWKGQRLKLSGAFPLINRVRGFFRYGNDPARII